MAHFRTFNYLVFKIFLILNFLGTSLSFADDPEENKTAISVFLKGNEEHKASAVQAMLNQGKDYIIEGDNIEVGAGFQLEWEGKGVLILQSQNDITFQLGSSLKSLGKGGLVLHPNSKGTSKTATVKFLSAESPSIDFSEGEGSISLFYNPEIGDKAHKYQNLTDWGAFIKTSSANYFKSFMFINDTENGSDPKYDPRDIHINLKGNYVLSCQIQYSHSIQSVPDKTPNKFEGLFLYNNYCLEPDWKGSVGGRLFQDFSNKWDKRILVQSPPLREEDRKLFRLVKKDKIEALKKLEIQPFLTNEKGETLLHFALWHQSKQTISYILQNLHDEEKLKGLLKREDGSGKTPLQVAVTYCDADLVKMMVQLYQKYNIDFDLRVLKEVVEERQKISSNIYVFLDTQTEEPRVLGKYWQGFSVVTQVADLEYERQKKVTKKFFARPFNNGETKTIDFRTKNFLMIF